MSIRIGKVLGIPIKVDISWLVIFALIVYSLGAVYFPETYHHRFTPAMNWLAGVVAALLLFASVLLHELMHSIVAIRNGLPVGGITLFIFGGVSQLSEEPRTPAVEFKMAIAGPATSLILGVALLSLSRLDGKTATSLTTAILSYLGLINISLGLFNLIPGFPLDGGRVLRAILWGSLKDLNRATRIAAGVGQGFGYLFIAAGFWIMLMNQFLSGLWMVFIGWFLNNAAMQSYQQVVLRKALSGVDVHRVMTTDFPHMNPAMCIDEFVHDYLLKYDYTAFPVSDGDNLLGIVTVNEVRNVPRADWHTTSVGQIATLPDERVIDENDDAFDALLHMAQSNTPRLLVMHNGKLKGMVTQESIVNIVRTKLQLGM